MGPVPGVWTLLTGDPEGASGARPGALGVAGAPLCIIGGSDVAAPKPQGDAACLAAFDRALVHEVSLSRRVRPVAAHGCVSATITYCDNCLRAQSGPMRSPVFACFPA